MASIIIDKYADHMPLYRIEHDIAAMPNTVSDEDKLALRQKRANRVFKRLFKKISQRCSDTNLHYLMSKKSN